MILCSMVDFILTNKYTETGHKNYANFLKQPLESWMFVPCDENGNVLSEPDADYYMLVTESEVHRYQQAKERCLFEGFEYREAQTEKEFSLIRFPDKNRMPLYPKLWKGWIIEDLVKYNLELTPTAIKQLGL